MVLVMAFAIAGCTSLQSWMPAMKPAPAAVPAPAAAPGPALMSGMQPPPSPKLPPPTDALSLRARYGQPNFIRHERDAELWRYDGQSCAAFFFLYREGTMWRLRYAETMPKGRSDPADPVCLKDVSALHVSPVP